MRSNWWLDATILASFFAHLAIVTVLIQRHSISRWRSLLLNSLVCIGTQTTLYFLRPHYTQYFWTFWVTYALIAAIHLWISYDVMRALPGTEYVPGVLRAVVLGTGVAVALGAWGSVAANSMSLAGRVSSSAVLFSRSVQIATVALLLVCLGALAISGLRWPPQTARIALGLSGRIVAGYIAASMYSSSNSVIRLSGNALDSLAEVFVLAYWAFALYQPEAEYDMVLTEEETRLLKHFHTPLQ